MEEKFKKLDRYEITLLRWDDRRGHRRLGLDRFDEGVYVYIVEKPTIEECLDSAIEYIENI